MPQKRAHSSRISGSNHSAKARANTPSLAEQTDTHPIEKYLQFLLGQEMTLFCITDSAGFVSFANAALGELSPVLRRSQLSPQNFTPPSLPETLIPADTVAVAEILKKIETDFSSAEGVVLRFQGQNTTENTTTLWDIAPLPPGIADKESSEVLWKGKILPKTQILSAENAPDNNRSATAPENSASYKQIAETLLDMVSIHTPSGHFKFVSPASQYLLGYKPEELIGKSAYDFCHPDDLALIYKRVQDKISESISNNKTTNKHASANAALGDEAQSVELRVKRKDGVYLWIESTARAVYDETGEILLFVQSVFRDVNKRKTEEIVRQKSEEHFRLLAEHSFDLIALHTPEGQYTYANPAILDLLGYTPEEIIGVNPYNLIHSEDSQRVQTEAHDKVLSGTPQRITFRIAHKNGSYKWLETTAKPIFSETDGSVIAIQSVSRDITERYLVTQELFRTKRLLDETNAIANVGGWEYIFETEELLWTNEIRRIYGLPAHHQPDLFTAARYYRSDYRGSAVKDFERLLLEGKEYDSERVLIARDGTEKWVRTVGKMEYRDGKPYRVYGTLQDITEHKQAQMRLKDRENFISKILATTPDTVFIFDLQKNRIVFTTENILRDIGYAPEEAHILHSEFLDSIVHPDDAHLNAEHFDIVQTLADGEIDDFTYRIMPKNGTEWRWFNLRSTPFLRAPDGSVQQVVVTSVDVTVRKRIEAELTKANEYLQSLVSLIPVPVNITRKSDGKLLFNNQAFQKLFELPSNIEEQTPATNFYKYPAERAKILALLRENNGKVENYETTLLTAQGQERRVVFSLENIIFNDEEATLSAVYDITERVRAEKALRDSEEQLHLLLMNIPFPISVTSVIDGKYIFANSPLRELYDLPNLTLNELPPSTDFYARPEERQAIIETMRKTGRVDNIEVELLTALGESKWVLGSAHFITFRGIPAIFTSFNEITERKKLLLRIERYNEELQSIIDTMQDGLVLVGADNRITLTNPAFRAMFGYTDTDGERNGDIVGMPLGNFILTKTDAAREAEMQTLYGKRADGTEFPIDASVSRLQYGSSDDIATGTLYILRDVSELRRKEQQIQESEANLRSIMESSVEAFCLIDTNLTVKEYNPVAVQLTFVFSGKELRTGDISSYFPAHLPERIHDALQAVLLGENFKVEQKISLPTAEDQWFEVLFLPTYNQYRRIVGITITGIDITETKKALLAIQALNQTLETRVAERTRELQSLNAEKDEFLGIAAHDLKNPLAGIMSSAQLLDRHLPNTPAVQRFVKIISEASAQMMDIITNLLDVNRLESGLVQMAPRKVGLEIITPIVETYQQRAAQKGILLHSERRITEESPLSFYADELALRQIFDNLISNAVKYSPQWKNVFIRISHSPTGDGSESPQQMIRVEIQDEGPGISQDDMKKLFGKFARLTAQPTGGENSTGLGLSIVKKLVEMQNGRVWCESELGKGATFIVEIPASIRH